MTFANASHSAALAVLYTEPDGRDVVIVTVKATFTRRSLGRLVLADRQVPIRPSDVPHVPDARDSSVRYPSDICTAKRGTDVVIVGDAISRSPVPVIDIAARIRDRGVHLRVHGERLYYRRAGRVAVGPAAPFTRKPVVYECAYGGTSPDFAVVERRNPVGRGVAHDPSDLVDTPAPQIEHPAAPITSAADRPEPVGFGAIGAHWLPRCGYAGTFDDAWRSARMPLLPVDFDIRFNNVAPPSLQFDEPLVAGERIAVLGMHVDGLWEVELPVLSGRISARLHDGQRLVVRPPIDTVLLEPGKDEVELTVRHAFAVGRGSSLLREVRVDEQGASTEVYAL
jgi:hypothetical protein